MYILAEYLENDTTKMGKFDSWDEYHGFFFNPEKIITNICYMCDRIPSEYHTRAQKKEYIREAAMMYQNSYSYDVDYFWSEIAEIGAWFERYGKRYGLLREFKENGII